MNRAINKMVRFRKLRSCLIALAQEDQEARTSLQEHLDDATFQSKLKQADIQRAEETLEILGIIKTPSVRNIGLDGSRAVWLIAQHNAEYKNFGDIVLKKMRYLYRKDKSQVYYQGIPFLVDRLMILKQLSAGVDSSKIDNLHLHIKQLYGTQFRTDSEGKLVKFKVVNPTGLQERRSKFGLTTTD